MYELFYVKNWLDDVSHEMFKVKTYINAYNTCCT